MPYTKTNVVAPIFLISLFTILFQTVIFSVISISIINIILYILFLLLISFFITSHYRDYNVIFNYIYILTTLNLIISYMILLLKQNYHFHTVSSLNEPGFPMNFLLKIPVGKENDFLLSNIFILLLAINYVLPALVAILVCLFDRRNRHRYFYNSFKIYCFSTMILYSIFLVYFLCIKETVYLYSSSFIPFITISSYIEDYIYKNIALQVVLVYIINSVLIYIPYGFFVGIFIKRTKFVRLIVLLALPVLLEIIKTFGSSHEFYIDSIILATWGGIIGIHVSTFLNYLFVTIKESNFMEDDYNNNLW